LVHIPKGCANAFLTLKDNTIVHYYCSQNYNPKAERGIRYNDKKFNIKVAPVVEITTAKTTDLAITGYVREIIIDEGCEV
jgi:dTDP-4-dehydrorhamnose 3,5-epimerase-like enzyme